MFVIKALMVFNWRQRVYFKQKLVRSFWYYDDNKITTIEEGRLKKYYRLSNTVNSMFYSLIGLLVTIYLATCFIRILDAVYPYVASLFSA